MHSTIIQIENCAPIPDQSFFQKFIFDGASIELIDDVCEKRDTEKNSLIIVISFVSTSVMIVAHNDQHVGACFSSFLINWSFSLVNNEHMSN